MTTAIALLGRSQGSHIAARLHAHNGVVDECLAHRVSMHPDGRPQLIFPGGWSPVRQGGGRGVMEKGRLRTESGWELPVSTDGSGLSAQHPRMRGLFLLVETVRREAGARQVRRGAASAGGCRGRGWFCSSGAVVLGRN